MSAYTCYENPKALSFSEVAGSRFEALWGTAIVNPFGPTLELVVLERELFDNGSAENPETTRMFRFVLNPFSAQCFIIGEAIYAPMWSPLDDLLPFHSKTNGSCPTLLLPNRGFGAAIETAFFAEMLSRYPDAPEVLSKVRKFLNDPVTRIQNDVDAIGTNLGEPKPKGGPEQERRPFGTTEGIELARLLLESRAHLAEFQAFATAWHGSIEFQQGSGLAEVVVPMKVISKIIGQAGLSCRVPRSGDAK